MSPYLILGCAECKHLGEELISSKAEVLRLLSVLSTHEEKSSLLAHQLAEIEKKFTAETNSKEDRISQLNIELESKSNTVAYLTQQLHQSKLRLKKALEGGAYAKRTYAAPTCAATGDPSGHDVILQPGHPSAGTSTRPYRTNRVVRRTTSSPVPQRFASSSQDQSASPEARSMHHLPTPPLPPHPPSSPQTTPPHPRIRRASTPRRRKSDLPPETSSPRDLTDNGQQPRPPSVSPRQQSGASRTNLDPMRGQRYPSPPDISDILQSQKSRVPVVTKPTPPVLPPIQSDICMATERRGDTPSPTEVLPQSKSVDSYGTCTFTESTDNPSSRLQPLPHRQRHIILAKSQGLSSAPSTLRVLRYGPRGLESKREEADVYKPGAAEGTLMVKENVNEKSQAWQELHQHGAD